MPGELASQEDVSEKNMSRILNKELGDVGAAVLAHLERRFSVHRNKEGLVHKRATPLLCSVQNGELEKARMQLDWGADIEAKDKDGYTTPLFLAIECGHLELVSLLLEKNANVSVKDEKGNTPLHLAVFKKQPRIVALLLKRGANIGAENNRGIQSLHVAVWNADSESIDILLRYRADIESKQLERASAIHLAAQNGCTETVALLLRHGARVDTSTNKGEMPLHLAARKGHMEATTLLLDHKADVLAKKSQGWTALHIATKNNHLEVVALLLDRKADVRALTSKWTSVMDFAKSIRNQEMIELLKKARARRAIGTLQLHVAIDHKDWKRIEFLLKAGIRFDLNKNKSADLVFEAAEQNHTNVVDQLLKRKPELSALKKEGIGLLHVAARGGAVETAVSLLRQKASIDAVDKKGITPLYLAAENKHQRLVNLLIERGANCVMATSFGNHAWDLIVAGLPKLVEALAGPRLLRVWRGKRMPMGVFPYEPEAAKKTGCSPGFIAITSLGKRCMMKLGWPDKTTQVSDSLLTTRRCEHRRSEVVAVKEKIAADIYALLGHGLFYVAKHRLAMVDPLNEYSKKHPDVRVLLAKFDQSRFRKRVVKKCVHLVSHWVRGYKNLGELTGCLQRESDAEGMPFLKYLERGVLPVYVRIEERVVKLLGLVELLAVARVLGDTDVLGGRGDNAGFVMERGTDGQVTAVRVVKIDAGESFGFKADCNQLIRSFSPMDLPNKLKDKKDIQFANNMPVQVMWSSLLEEQKNTFLTTLKYCMSVVRRPRFLELMIRRKGLFDQARIGAKKLITDKMVHELIEGFHYYLEVQEKREVYGSELIKDLQIQIKPSLSFQPKVYHAANYTMQDVNELLDGKVSQGLGGV